MRFECNRTELQEALTNCSRAAAQKSALTVIEGILMRATATGLHLCCYNLDMGIAKNIPAHIQRTGSAVMPMRFVDMIRRMPGERVIVDCSEKLIVHIESALTEFDIAAMPADDFPELPTVESEFAVQIEERKLRSVISQTSHALYSKPDLPIYTGALFELDKDSLKVTTLDGCRVAVRNEPVNCLESNRFIVPGKSLTDVSRLLSDSEDLAEINVGKHNIVFSINGYSVVSRLLTGKFTDCTTLFNTAGSIEVRAKTSDMLACVERMALVITESFKSPVRCTFSENKIQFSCTTPMGKADSSLVCESAMSAPMTIGINNRYMVDAFRAVDTDEIRIMIIDRMRPMIILPPEGEHFMFLIMPLNLNDAAKQDDNPAEERYDRSGYTPADTGAEEDPEADFGSDNYDDDRDDD